MVVGIFWIIFYLCAVKCVKMKKIYLAITFTVVLPSLLTAQSTIPEFWNISIGVGATAPFSDLNQFEIAKSFGSGGVIEYQPGISLHVGKLSPRLISLQGSLFGGIVAGFKRRNIPTNAVFLDEIFGTTPTVSGARFRTMIYHGTLDALINLRNLGHHSHNTNRKIMIYAKIGVGLGYVDPKVEFLDASGGTSPAQRAPKYVSEDGKVIFNMPVGLGLKYRISESLDLGLSATYNMLSTDRMDGVSVANTSKDSYAFTALTIGYTINSASKSVEEAWQHPAQASSMQANSMAVTMDSLKNELSKCCDKSKEATQDSDNDGVPDVRDKEPLTPKGAIVDSDGVGKDSDGDGVLDGIDKEPNTPSGKIVNFQGIALNMPSSSGSAQTNSDLRDPSAGKTPLRDGKIEPPASGYSSSSASYGSYAGIAYFPSVYFSSGSTVIRREDVDKLVSIARTLKANPSLQIVLVGHADKTGSPEVNKRIAEARAKAVSTFLIKNFGIEADRISIETKGNEEPVSDKLLNINRRVDIFSK